MSNNLHNELRKEFQLDRLILFSDAVFAIAITLLAIEIKIPEIPKEQLTESNVLHHLKELVPKFIGFFISFLIIAQYWIVHHRMFGYVIHFTERLIWLNMYFLLAIALMPFSTGFYSEYVTHETMTPVIFYTANITVLGLISFIMWRYISNPKRKISENLTAPLITYFSIRAITVPVIFIIFCIAYLFNPMLAAWIPVSIPIIMRIAFGRMKQKIAAASNPKTT